LADDNSVEGTRAINNGHGAPPQKGQKSAPPAQINTRLDIDEASGLQLHANMLKFPFCQQQREPGAHRSRRTCVHGDRRFKAIYGSAPCFFYEAGEQELKQLLKTLGCHVILDDNFDLDQ